MSPDLPIPASAIEAAATVAKEQAWVGYDDLATKMLCAAFDELGMEREEYSDPSDLMHTTIRLVSRWMPVEES